MAGILFDLDGTLHDRVSGIAAFAADQYSRRGADPELLSRYVERFVNLDANGKIWKDQVYSHLVNEFELIGRPTVDELVSEYVSVYPRFAVECRGASSVLRQLNALKFKICILTNGRGDLQRAVIASLGLDSLVHAIVISQEVGFRKPDRDIFDLALGELGVDAGRAVMIGDDRVADIAGATKAGIRSIAFACADPSGATMVATTMAEVFDAAVAMLGVSAT